MDETKPAPSRALPEFERWVSAAVFAMWISICSAAPELLWRGVTVTIAHGGHVEWLSALLFGLMSVFFIEPVLHRGRSLLEGHGSGGEDLEPWSPLFRFLVGFAFGVASMFIHEAFGAYLNADETGSEAEAGARTAIQVTISWAVVPFMIALAWQSTRPLWIGAPLGLAAALSSAFAGWWFEWTVYGIATTAIPCLLIQGLGYLRLSTNNGRLDFARLAPVVLAVAAAWIVLSSIFDFVMGARGSPLARIYAWDDVFVDARFYFGWCLGLLLVPSAGQPAHEEMAAGTTPG
jgi:hypothetical protein